MTNLQNFLIDHSSNLRDALKLIEKNKHGICFITKEYYLLGCLTDGDIRRALLKGNSLETLVIDVCNKKCISSHYQEKTSKVLSKLSSKIKFIPLLDSNGFVVDITSNEKHTLIPIMEPDLSGNEGLYLQK